MKKLFTPTLTKINLWLIFVFAMLLLFVNSCRKDKDQNHPLSKTELITEAQSFFEDEIINLPQLKDNNLRHSLNKTPLWDKAAVRKISIGDAVIIPIKYDKDILLKQEDQERMIALEKTSYLMVYKNKEQHLQAEWVILISDQEKGSKFAGIINIEQWNGKPKRAFAIKDDGEALNIYQSESVIYKQISYKKFRGCLTIDQYGWFGAEGHEVPILIGSETYCSSSWSNNQDQEVDNSVGGEGGGGGGGGGDTGPNDYTPDCDGVIGSGAYTNTNCNTCMGGTTGITECPPTKENELANELEENAALLLDCELAKAFKSLASYKPPQSVNDRIAGLNTYSNQPTLFSNPYFVQQIQNASGIQINLDRFEINIATLPIVGGNRLSADEFLKYIRKNLNDFVDNNIATFDPFYDPNDVVNDASRWNSDSPLGSILHLDMADNGAVIVSDYAWNHWTVSTLRTPLDGAHPVSGNRSWGYDFNSSGGYTFYVTGADRITRGLTDMVQLLTEVPFSAADQLWQSYQSKVSAFVNNNAGSSTVGNQITERPNYAALKDYFDGKITLQQLKNLKGCK